METIEKRQTEELEDPKASREPGKNDSLFHTEEIVIEELAIDGICGVY